MDEAAVELRSRLAELHRQLQTTGKIDPESRALLVEVLADIARVLEAQQADALVQTAGGKPLEPQHLTGQLAEAARRFEETHPNLSATIGSVITALSRTGI